MQASIQRYQDSLQYARLQLNFVVGENLYLLPSDMNLRIGTYAGYNYFDCDVRLVARIESSHEFRVSTRRLVAQ